MTCCGKTICSGCCFAVARHGSDCCPFCRAPTPDEAGYVKQLKMRVECDDARAYYELGHITFNGHQELNVAQDRDKGLKLWQRAGELGCATAYSSLAYVYREGEGVPRDEGKARHYYELAVMGGNARARHFLGYLESRAGNVEIAFKHWTISAGSGNVNSLSNIQMACMSGEFAAKAHYEKALRAYQQYLEDIRSEPRDEAAAFRDDYQYLVEQRHDFETFVTWRAFPVTNNQDS
jgi:TPR repeat protein